MTLLAMVAVLSCGKPLPERLPDPSTGPMAHVTIRAENPTKTIYLEEDRVGSLAVWLYKAGDWEDGKDAAYFNYAESEEILMSCLPGNYDIVVATNFPESAIDMEDNENNLSISTLDGKVSLGDMNPIGLTATGYLLNKTIEEGSEFTIDVDRRVSKVTVEKITNSITGSKYGGQTVTVKEIYIVNGTGTPSLFKEDTPDIDGWFSCSAKYNPSDGIYPDFGQMTTPELSYESNINKDIASGESYECPVILLTGPNSTEEDVKTGLEELPDLSSWSFRKTRVVVECLIAGETFYYPITLDSVGINCWYRITELKLLHQGSRSPDIPVKFVDVTITGKITDWDGKEISETI